jgi:NADPH:quinone reductase-like Zn-dependent oxidoreductase
MKAIVQNEYGSPDVLKLEEVDKPVVKENDVLVRVHAAALNAGDYFPMRGSPWLVRFVVGFPKPKNHILGWDVAGHVDEVGKNVKRFHPGDEVFGSKRLRGHNQNGIVGRTVGREHPALKHKQQHPSSPPGDRPQPDRSTSPRQPVLWPGTGSTG